MSLDQVDDVNHHLCGEENTQRTEPRIRAVSKSMQITSLRPRGSWPLHRMQHTLNKGNHAVRSLCSELCQEVLPFWKVKASGAPPPVPRDALVVVCDETQDHCVSAVPGWVAYQWLSEFLGLPFTYWNTFWRATGCLIFFSLWHY